MMDQNTFPDLNDYDLQRKQLQRRRALAEQLLATRNTPDATLVNGRAMFGGGPGQLLANGVDAISGQLQQPMLDQEEKDLAAREAQQANSLLSNIPKEQGQARQQALLMVGQQMPSLRNSISALLASDERAAEAERARIEKGEQQAADRVAREESDAKYKRTIEDAIRLKGTPSQHITIQNGGGAAGDGKPNFVGAATQIGVDPRDNQPVYRVGKTNQHYKYGQNGQEAYNGLIGPKPANAGVPTESERSSAGYLGRMEAVEEAIANSTPLPYYQQRGLEKAPGLTNFVMSPEQQVTRQKHEDWVRAKLRKESGAVIGDEEMAREIRTYIPVAGDSPAVLAAKAQARAQAREQLKSSAGRAPSKQAAPVAPTEKKRIKFSELP